MNKPKAFIRQYKYELIAFVVNIVSVLLSVWLTTPKIAFVMVVAVFTLSMFVVIYFRTKDRDFYFLPLNKPGDEKDWVGRGRFAYIRNENCFEITESDAGYIFPRTANWDDYKFECDFKIVKKYFGCIVRAMNLSNCVMYQLRNDKKIRVHLRINGEWIVTEESPVESELKPDNWYKLKIVCEKRSVRVNIKDGNSSLIDRHFIIPPQIKIVYRELDTKGNEITKETRQLQNIDFDFGSIGIRNYGDERAFVKNIFIEKL